MVVSPRSPFLARSCRGTAWLSMTSATSAQGDSLTEASSWTAFARKVWGVKPMGARAFVSAPLRPPPEGRAATSSAHGFAVVASVCTESMIAEEARTSRR